MRRPPVRSCRRAPASPSVWNSCGRAGASFWRCRALQPRRRRIRRGVGIACMWYGIGNTSMSNPSTMRLSLAPDGTITFWNGGRRHRSGLTTVLAQIAADALGAPVSLLRHVIGDTDRTFDAARPLPHGRPSFPARRPNWRRWRCGRDPAPDQRRARCRDPLRRSVLTIEEEGRRTALDLAALPPLVDGEALEGIGRSTRRPNRWTRTGRACPTPPTASGTGGVARRRS